MVVSMKTAHFQNREITQATGYSKSQINRIFKRWKEQNTVEVGVRMGRPSCMSVRDVQRLTLLARRDPFLNSEFAARLFYVSRRSIDRYLTRIFKKKRVARRRENLPVRHRSARLNWCRDHQDWTPEDWARVIFSDETLVQLNRLKCRIFVWRPVNSDPFEDRYVVPRSNDRHNQMIWGMMSAHEPPTIVYLTENVTSVSYEQTLRTNLVPVLNRLILTNPIFQQDGAAPHRGARVQNLFDELDVDVLPWPARSPDLSPIETLWAFLKNDIAHSRCENIDDAIQISRRFFDNLNPLLSGYLIRRMPARIAECIRVRGKRMKY